MYSKLQIHNILPHCTVTSMRDPWTYRHGIMSHQSALLHLMDIYIFTTYIYHMVKIYSCDEDELHFSSEGISEIQIYKYLMSFVARIMRIYLPRFDGVLVA